MLKTLTLHAVLLAGLSVQAWAGQISIQDPWVRATAPGQKVAGGFMKLTADADMKLVAGSSVHRPQTPHPSRGQGARDPDGARPGRQDTTPGHPGNGHVTGGRDGGTSSL